MRISEQLERSASADKGYGQDYAWYLLLKNYESEPDNDSVEVMLLYLELANRMP